MVVDVGCGYGPRLIDNQTPWAMSTLPSERQLKERPPKQIVFRAGGRWGRSTSRSEMVRHVVPPLDLGTNTEIRFERSEFIIVIQRKIQICNGDDPRYALCAILIFSCLTSSRVSETRVTASVHANAAVSRASKQLASHHTTTFWMRSSDWPSSRSRLA